MPEWERVKQTAEEVAPGSDECGQWATTHKNNETLSRASDFLRQYSKRLKEEADAKDDAGQTK